PNEIETVNGFPLVPIADTGLKPGVNEIKREPHLKMKSCLALRIQIAIVSSLILSLSSPTFSQSTNRPLISYADPFVGTDNGGNIVPGAQVPFGFVHVSPDTVNPNTAGYRPNEDIVGFSQTHVSG